MGRIGSDLSDDRAIDLQPRFDRAWYERGIAFSRMGLHLEAVHNYDKALHINPEFLDAASRHCIALQYTQGFRTKP